MCLRSAPMICGLPPNMQRIGVEAIGVLACGSGAIEVRYTSDSEAKADIPQVRVGRVEDGRGSLGHPATPRFPSPLIEPDVPISGIRLSDRLHREAHGSAMSGKRSRCMRPRSPETTAQENRLVPRPATLCLRLRLTIQLSLKALDPSRCCQAHRQSPSPRHLRKHTRSQGPSLCRHYPASSVV